MSPEVTVLMSVYNGELFLRESIESILNQTFNDFEYLIINDGSTDSSRDIIESYNDSRIVLYNNEENMGLTKSLNIGIHRARGEYIARQDADDVSHPDRLKMQYEYMETNNCDVTCCRYQYIDKRGKRLLWVSEIFSSQSLKRTLIDLKDPIAHGSVLMNKNSLVDAGEYNESFEFSQDYELWLRLLSMGKRIECVDYVGYYQRLLPQVDKTKRDTQRWYTAIVNDYYVNGKAMSTSEFADLKYALVSSGRFKQRIRKSVLRHFSYWFKIQNIQFRAFFESFLVKSRYPRHLWNNGIRVLMVTGVYHPEVSGAANQCRQLVNTLKEKAIFEVLTTTRDPNLPSRCQIDGVDVSRVLLERSSVRHYCKAALKFMAFFLSRRKHFQIVHLHGFSLKSVLIVILSKIFHKKIIIKMTSLGHDEPVAMMQRGYLLNYFFSRADVYVGMTPRIQELYYQSKLPSNRLKQVPNGVDTDRFSPVTDQEKVKLRNQLGLPENIKLILFVGHFSREKCPDLLLTAWKRHVAETSPDSGIVFVGSTNPDHYEVDAELVSDIQQLAKPYINKNIFFIERAHEIEKYYKTADMFILPSLREGLPNSLLEAMACGLPVIVSKLNGISDWIVKDGINGCIVPSSNMEKLGKAIIRILVNKTDAYKFGLNGRIKVVENFSIDEVTKRYEKVYSQVIQNYRSLN